MKLLLLLITLTAAAQASIIRTGVFSFDDNVQLFHVTMPSAGVLTVRSAGYGGDTGLSINPGGFDTVLSLFDANPAGLLLAMNNDASCLEVSPDPQTGMCWDAKIDIPLPAGHYIVALSQYDNWPNGPALPDGFLRAGAGNFTPGLSGFPGTAFLDSLGNQRTSNWTLVFDGVSVVTTVPEPSNLAAGLGAMLALAALRNWRAQS